MKCKTILIFCFFFQLCAITNSIAQTTTAACYSNFDGVKGITKGKMSILPVKNPISYRSLPTLNGVVKVSYTSGIRTLYNNDKKMPFVSLKVESSSPQAYSSDTLNYVNYLKYVIPLAKKFTSDDVLKIKKNGYTIYGYINKTIEGSTILGSFVIFPRKDIIIYIDFINQNPMYRSYENINQLNEQIDLFLKEYTIKIKECSPKS